ncbi:MAG: class II D-tagatose-bisphosphate aldolase, non-catalytic subunit, partial [Bacteroidota bacterium]
TLLTTDRFDADKAAALTARARAFGALVKGHDTDFVAHPEAYPASGMGAANLGPECTAAEYAALLDLAALEGERLPPTSTEASGIARVVFEAVAAHPHWRKWLGADERGARLADLAPERQRWIVATGVRYVWTRPAVAAARAALFANVAAACDPDAVVDQRIEAVVKRYADAFALPGLCERLAWV